MKTRIDYKYVHLNFDWNWIKDKQIVVKGNEWAGMVIVLDDKGRAVGMYGYEAIENE
jgi:hypothetical protein